MKEIFLALIFLAYFQNAAVSKKFKIFDPLKIDATNIEINRILKPNKLRSKYASSVFSNLTSEEENGTSQSTQCSRDIEESAAVLNDDELWASLMHDSNVKKMSNKLNGNRVVLGNMEECLNVRSDSRNISGQYCLVYFNDTKDPIEWKYLGSIWFREPYFIQSHCFPSSCSPNDILTFFDSKKNQTLLSNFPALQNPMFEVGIMPGDCMTKGQKIPFTTTNWITAIILGVLGSLVIISSTLDILQPTQSRKSVWEQHLMAFSVVKNGKQLLEAINKKGKGSSSMVTGLKSLTALYVVATHIVYTHLNALVDSISMAVMSQDGSQYGAAFLNNGYSSVDTFLLIAGVLMVFSFLNEVKRKGTYDPVVSFIKRYFRLMLPLFVMYLIRIGISEHLGYGPVYHHFNNYHRRNCVNELIPMVFGYLNFHDFPFNTCFQQTWYVFLDLQLFVVSHIVLLVALWKPNRAMALSGLLALGGLMIDFAITYINELGFIPPYDKHLNMLLMEYVVPHTRSTPWFFGMALGFYLKKCERKKITFSLLFQIITWTLHVLVFATTYIPVICFKWGRDTGPWQALFGAYRRLGWSFMVAWPIYMAHVGYAGIPIRWLEWPPIAFYGIISYELYLLHFPLIEFLVATGRETFYLSFARLFYIFFPILVYTSVLAVIMYLFITVPLSIVVQKILQNIKIFPMRHRWEVLEKTNQPNGTRA